jgi:plasmid maintenance system antidote protein VapI
MEGDVMIVKRINLYEAMVAKNLSPAEAARAFKLSEASVRKLVSGDQRGSPATWARIEAALGTGRDLLMVVDNAAPRVKSRFPIVVRRPFLEGAMAAKGLTRAETARRVGVVRSTINFLLDGSGLGSVRLWDKLEALLGVDQREMRRIVEPGAGPGAEGEPAAGPAEG